MPTTPMQPDDAEPGQEMPVQTDNRPRPEDGDQPDDSLQKPGSLRDDLVD